MLALAVISLLLVGAAFAGLLYFLRYLKRQNPSIGKTVETHDGETSVQSFFGIQSIDRGIVVLTGGRYRVYIEAPSLNVPLMADEEQEMLESRFAALLRRMNFPIQFYIQNRPLDMRDVLQELSDYDEAPENLQEYAEQLKWHLANLSVDYPIWVRRNLIVVGYENQEATMDVVIKELSLRADLILSELDAAGIEGRCLTTEEIAQVFYTQFNKNRSISMPFRNVVEAGHTQTIVRGRDFETVQ